MSAHTLVPDRAVVRLDYVVPGPEATTLVLTTCRTPVACPPCGHPATRIHSRYCRSLADLPWNGIAVRLQLHTRRFFCDQPHCARRIFAEPLPSIGKRCAR